MATDTRGGGRAFAITLAASLAAMGVLAAFAAAGWPGQANGCEVAVRPTCFCETLHAGPIRQPSNTLSNLGFVAVGLVIAAAADRRRGRAAPANPMTTTRFHPTAFAVVTALLGPGSMALHASMTVWGGRVDVISMYLFIAYVAVYGAARIAAWSTGRFAAVYAATVLLLSASKIWTPVSSDVVFGAMVGLAALTDPVMARRRPDRRFERRWLAAAGVLFGVAFAIWLPSRSGGALCDPDSWVQGHALWHLLCAGAAGCIFLYLRSERSLDADSGPG
jgi:hypothetical protein